MNNKKRFPRKSVVGLGAAITSLRKHTRWSQTELAEKIGAHQVTICRWEQSNPTDVLRVPVNIVATIRELATKHGAQVHISVL